MLRPSVLTISLCAALACAAAAQGQPQSGQPQSGQPQSDQPQPGGVRGVVLTPAGAPAAGVHVYLLPPPPEDEFEAMLQKGRGEPVLPLAAATTDADGRFALQPRQAIDRAALRVVGRDWPEVEVDRLQLAGDGWTEAGSIRLQAGRRLHGKLLAAAGGAPLAGGTVRMFERGRVLLAVPGRERGQLARADADGCYRIDNAPAGGITLVAEAPGHATEVRHLGRLPAAGESSCDFELVVARSIAGTVVDSDGRPIAGAVVTAAAVEGIRREQAHSGADGSFACGNLLPGEYRVDVAHPGHLSPPARRLAAGSSDVQLQLATLPAVRLRLRAAGGRPVMTATVVAKRATGVGFVDLPALAPWYLDPDDFRDGAAVLTGMPAGHYALQVAAPGCARQLTAEFTIGAGDGPLDLQLQLDAGATLHGLVLDPAGRPVAGAEVATAGADEPLPWSPLARLQRQAPADVLTRARARTDAHGRYRFLGVERAQYRLLVRHPDFVHGELAVQVAGGGEVAAAPLQLQRGVLLHGRLLSGGRPIGGHELRFCSGPANEEVLAVDADGRFAIRLPPGSYEVRAGRLRLPVSGRSRLELPFELGSVELQAGQQQLQAEFDLRRR